MMAGLIFLLSGRGIPGIRPIEPTPMDETVQVLPCHTSPRDRTQEGCRLRGPETKGVLQ